MVVITNSSALISFLEKVKTRNQKIGFIPTMGALHEGHFSLMESSLQKGCFSIVSIFINPVQFNDIEDFKKYPKSVSSDLQHLNNLNIPCVYLPEITEVYPNGMKNLENYDLKSLETVFEGAHRPGHFQGVCQVLSRLFKLIEPDFVFMGQKDYQQCMVVQKLIEIENMDIKLDICPTVRENSGLAKSSRNLRLSEEEKRKAASLYKNMQFIRENLQKGNENELIHRALEDLKKHDFIMEYLSFADAKTLEPVKLWNGKDRLVLLAAGKMGEVRLIDNLIM